MGPGVRVDTARTRESEILAGLSQLEAGGDGAEAEPAEQPAAAATTRRPATRIIGRTRGCQTRGPMSANPPGPPSETGRPQLPGQAAHLPGGAGRDAEFDPRRLLKRTLQIVLLLGVFGLVILLAPGLGSVRDLLTRADPGWIVLAVVLEALGRLLHSCSARSSAGMPWRTTGRSPGRSLRWARSCPPAAPADWPWGLDPARGRHAREQIARRSVAFFLIKNSVSFVAVVVVGTVMALGLAGPDLSIWLAAVPAVGAAGVIALILVLPRLKPGSTPGPDRGQAGTWGGRRRRALINGAAEAITVVRSGDLLVIFGAIGYWAFDNAVLWATFQAFDASPPISVILLGYLVGQLGGLLPIPGGIGIDGGLFGRSSCSARRSPAAAAVLAYRVILFWLPLIVGAIAFLSLRRGLNRPDRPDLCVVPAASWLRPSSRSAHSRRSPPSAAAACAPRPRGRRGRSRPPRPR